MKKTIRENIQRISFETRFQLSGKDFEELVEKAINELDDEKFKVVVSRKEEVEINEFDIEIVFNKMLQMYPSAFKYFSSPKNWFMVWRFT
ncbi:MAG: hypothetical protein U0T80_08925 [Flavobacteriaceae bacterium]